MHQEPRHGQLLRCQRPASGAYTVFEDLLARLAYIEGHGEDGGHGARHGARGETVNEGVGVVLPALGPAALPAAGTIAVEFATACALTGVG